MRSSLGPILWRPLTDTRHKTEAFVDYCPHVWARFELYPFQTVWIDTFQIFHDPSISCRLCQKVIRNVGKSSLAKSTSGLSDDDSNGSLLWISCGQPTHCSCLSASYQRLYPSPVRRYVVFSELGSRLLSIKSANILPLPLWSIDFWMCLGMTMFIYLYDQIYIQPANANPQQGKSACNLRGEEPSWGKR